MGAKQHLRVQQYITLGRFTDASVFSPRDENCYISANPGFGTPRQQCNAVPEIKTQSVLSIIIKLAQCGGNF